MPGICAGKTSVAEYLVSQQGFARLHLIQSRSSEWFDDLTINDSNLSKNESSHFRSAETLLDFVTKNWQKRWVTTDVLDEATLEQLQKRPFFLLVSVDAPVSLRWRRLVER